MFIVHLCKPYHLSDTQLTYDVIRNESKLLLFLRKMPGLNTQEIYATLPKSLKSELHVRSRVEDPDVQRQRKELTQSKSVSELAQVKSLADFPIPANIEKLIQSRGASASAKQSTVAG